jgi:class 3 adenylate cyclase
MDHLIDINARADTHYVFLFTDIEGSTQRWARYPEAMGAAMARHDTLLREGVADLRGLPGIRGGLVRWLAGDVLPD